MSALSSDTSTRNFASMWAFLHWASAGPISRSGAHAHNRGGSLRGIITIIPGKALRGDSAAAALSDSFHASMLALSLRLHGQARGLPRHPPTGERPGLGPSR